MTCLVYLIFGVLFVANHCMTSKNFDDKYQISSAGKKVFINGTVYLGYANNPFGASIPFQNNKNRSKLFEFSNPIKYRLVNKRLPNDKPSSIYVKNAKFQSSRSKRGVYHLYNMVSCATGCNPLIYKGYGCYCGFLGSGYTVDGIDMCCKRHDWCYDKTNCPAFLEYFMPYYWTCFNNKPFCAIEQGEWGGPDSCAHRLCECDRILSECLSRFTCPSSRAFCKSSSLRLFQNALMII